MQSPFHAYITARKLSGFADDPSFMAAFASTNIGIYPYQIAAAQFALRSLRNKGAILCDEGSLGKTYEALLVATQLWHMGRDKQLIILPQNLVAQWATKIEGGFTLPYLIWTDGDLPAGDGLPDEDAVIITTYDFAVRNADAISNIAWDLVIFDEADVLFKPDNKTVQTLKSAVGDAFKLLLTPTPITMSIMDIYGLLHFIDESVLPESDEFYKRYFRKPENYPELSAWTKQYAFRTLKSQVTEYVNFTERLPVTLEYSLSEDEKELYAKVDAYLAVPRKEAYPQMDKYDLTLMFFHILSSSPQAFCRTIEGALERVKDDGERGKLTEILSLAQSIETSGKMNDLQLALKICFARLKQLKLSQKAIVFVDNLTTFDCLQSLLDGYTVITSREQDYIARFRAEKSAVLVATDTAAKGLDMEFCPLVINYDLIYNAITLEQRIARCHRQGQQSDVLVVNLLSRENVSDVRILELINKRVAQFDGIFGMSDSITGEFGVTLDEMLAKLRPEDEIEAWFTQNLIENKDKNRQTIVRAEDTLFTTFTKSVADKVAVTPQYVAEKSAEIETDLWSLATHYFAERDEYKINENTRTITLVADAQPHLFYYWAGRQNRPYKGLKQYGIGADSKPSSGRITLASPIGKGLLQQTVCSTAGTLTVTTDIEPCEIAFYEVSVANRGFTWAHNYYIFAGKTSDGTILTDDECRKIMDLPTISYTEDGEQLSPYYRTSVPPHELDNLVDKDAFLDRYLAERDSEFAEDSEQIMLRANRQKNELGREIRELRRRVDKAKQSAESGDRMAELRYGKQLKILQTQLRERELAISAKQTEIDRTAKQVILEISSKTRYNITVRRQFVVQVRGGQAHE